MYRQTDSEGRRPTAAVTVRRARGLNRYWVRRRRTGCILLHQKQEHLPQARCPFPLQRYLYKDAFPQQVYSTNICHLDTASWERCTVTKIGHCSLSHRLSLNVTQVKGIALFIYILSVTWWWLHTSCLHLTDRQTQSDLCVNKVLRVARYSKVIQTKRQTCEKCGRLGTVAKEIVGRNSMATIGHLSNTPVVAITSKIGRWTKSR